MIPVNCHLIISISVGLLLVTGTFLSVIGTQDLFARNSMNSRSSYLNDNALTRTVSETNQNEIAIGGNGGNGSSWR